jgi:hypothetical protein
LPYNEDIDQNRVNQVNIPGLGVVEKDGVIFHKKHGRGVVQDIMAYEGGPICANIKFLDGVHPMMLDVPELLALGVFSFSPFCEDERK